LGELSGRSRTAQSSIGSLADSFNRYQGMAIAAVAAVTGVVLSIQKIIDINGKLSDAQADVMKTTGQTKEEVDELTKSFGLLQTRTSRIDLLGIAEQGGRIGIAKEEIGDFVNVMNKAAVSLGDSFTGGAEEVANKLGKIKFLFQETKDLNVDQAYNSIGSAINDLGANGVASENNIAEFTTRIGSLPDLLKPSIQETLALGAAFEESGIEAEVSSRAYGIFMKQASTETAKFAKVMGISEQKVKDMINANPLEFMLNFSKGLKEMSDKGTDVAATLDYLGISADGANKVIGAMGNNTARFRQLIELSNNSFASGTSLINEYNIKNNNLAATLEKISKTVSGWFSSETFIKWLTIAVGWLAKFIGATEDADGSVTAWKNTLVFTAKIIAIVTAAMITNVGWQKLVALWTTRNTEATLIYNIAQKANAVATGIATIATELWAAVVAIATRDVVGLRKAITAMTLAMKTTPWGFCD
jgi:TP901 family phage tail tape measure protein